MMDRLDALVAIRGGEVLLAHISVLEKNPLQQVYDNIDMTGITFYGIAERPVSKSPFSCLFTNDMKTLQFHLDNENDIERAVWNISSWRQVWYSCYNRVVGRGEEHPRFKNILWNHLTLLEVAVLLHHEEAIRLLLTYQRRTWHTKDRRKSSFLETGIELAEQAGKNDVVNLLKNCSYLPSVWSKQGMNAGMPPRFVK